MRQVPVPCGNCPPCKKRRVDSWVFRLMQEEKVSSSAYFVTLTYNTENVPLTPRGWMTLNKGYDIVEKVDKKTGEIVKKKKDRCDFTKYMKRLRKLCGGNTLKYYAVGEYGTDNQRPHWHAIIFNVPRETLLFDAWHLDGKQLGQVHVGQVSGDSIAYCCKYLDKEQTRLFGVNRQGYKFYFPKSVDDRVPEFSLMSKGLGANYVTESIKKYHLADQSRLYLTVDGGFKIAMPRYYKDLIFSPEDMAHQLGLIQSAVAEKNRENEALYKRLHGHRPAFSYEQFVESQRKARYQKFYKQKSRNVE